MNAAPTLSADASAGMARLAAELRETILFDTITLGVLEHGQEKVLVFSLKGKDQSEGALQRVLPVSSRHFAKAFESRCPVADTVSPRNEPALWEDGVTAGLVVPVELYGRVIGSLNLGRHHGEFDENDSRRVVDALEPLRDRVASLILHLKSELSESSARRSYEQLIAFSRVGSLIVQEKDLDRICNLFMQALREHSVFRRGILTLLDDDLKGYKWFFFGMSDEEIEYFHSHSNNKMTREQRAKIFQDRYRVGNSYYIPASSDWEYTGVRSRQSGNEMLDWNPDDFLFIPLYGSHKRLVGVVSVDDPSDGLSPSAETLSSLELFANQVAHGIEEKKLDQEVKKSTRKYKTLVETMNDGLVVMDLSERITLVNPTLCKLVGYRLEEVIGSSIYTFLTDDSRKQVQSKQDERRLGIKSRYEVELLSKDGVTIPVLMSGAPLYEANRLLGSFSVVSDLREQKKAEDDFRKMHFEIMDANEKLRASMDQLETTQEQLVQAEKLSAIGELVSGVAHELNNPLTGVLGYAQLLAGKETSGEVQKQLNTIYKEALRCQKIVQNLLTFARKHKPEKSSVDVNEILAATVELRAYQLRVDNIEVTLELDPKLPKTMADYHQLQQVFINLINNAHHAMLDANGRGHLRILTEVADENIVVRFQDDGTGIQDDKMGRIFDPFFTTKSVGKGTGLGLSLSYGIIKEHGGDITVRNALEGGAVFELELPVRQEEPSQSRERRAPNAEPTASGKRILVVDDEETVVQLLADLLSSRGHMVETETDGRRALDKIRAAKQEFDLVISDMKMPVMDGRQLYEQLREVSPGLSRRMIFTTGDTVSEAARHFFDTNGHPVVSKPFNLEEVERLIGEVIQGELASETA